MSAVNIRLKTTGNNARQLDIIGMLEIARSRFKDLSKRTADLHKQACYIGNDIVDRAVAVGLDTLDHYSVSRENILILKGYRARTCGILLKSTCADYRAARLIREL